MITTTTTTTTETMQSPHDHSCFPPLRAVLHPVLVLVMFVPVCTCDYFDSSFATLNRKAEEKLR